MFIRAIDVLAALCLIAGPLAAQTGSEALRSPDAKLEIAFEPLSIPAPAPQGARRGPAAAPQVAPEGGQLTYRVAYNGKPVLLSSRLGLDLQGQPLLGSAVRIASASRTQADETYRLVWGKNNPVRDHYNALRLELQETVVAGRRFTLEARAYDDGVAFRYVLPEQTALGEVRLSGEATEFHISKDAVAFPLYVRGERSSYEDVWHRRHLTRFLTNQLVGLPLLMEVPAVAWLAIAEADLDDYAGMYLVSATTENANTTLRTHLAPAQDDPALAVTGSLPHRSSWRVLMIADQPGRLIESNIILNLNPPCAIADTSWIKPGKSAWSWWSGNSATGAGFRGAMNTQTMKYYTDFAASAGLEYVLFDGGWSSRNDVTTASPQLDMPELLRYAAAKGVKVWLWLHWTSADKQMDQAFPLYEKWGVAGVKIDFMDSNEQARVNFYHRTARLAARHHLMIDFHGAYPPTGLRRTYPNVLTHEGILGLEYSKWSPLPDPEHNVMIPFTRMLAGPMDYTPGGFDNVTRAEFVAQSVDPMVLGTRAHQLALYVVLESPLQMVSDRPGAYANEPAFDFIKAVPTSWDETRVVSGEVGQHIAIARRLGKDWYLGAVTNWSPRQLELPLAFLGAGQFTAEIYADAPDAATAPKRVTIQKQRVGRDTRLKLDLAPGGGCAIHIRPM
jgi:alpha-glucosidase